MSTLSKLRQFAINVINTEIDAIQHLTQRIDEHFIKACELLLQCKGRVVVTGMGKSGHIANKIAATLASTGTPAFFVHPGEASHGDMGMIVKEDIILALSNSGSTPELLTILPFLKQLNIPLITLTGNPNSILAKEATINLDVSVAKEACPLELAPTASTTAALVMGDALAMALLEARGFTKEDFARSHPGGALGKRLLLHINDLMHSGDEIPRVQLGTSMRDTLLEMTRKKLGMTTVVDETNRLMGIFTDGDLRRAFEKNIDLQRAIVNDFMTKNPCVLFSDNRAIDALNLMEQHKITNLAIIDEESVVVGVLHMHDLLRAGVV